MSWRGRLTHAVDLTGRATQLGTERVRGEIQIETDDPHLAARLVALYAAADHAAGELLKEAADKAATKRGR